MPLKIAAGNWKMNGLRSDLAELSNIDFAAANADCETIIGLPATLLGAAQVTAIALAGQDCHSAVSGAHTGDVSAQMVADTGATYVILGHSERRADHGETSDLVRAKTQAALDAGLTPIICCGESLDIRESGQALDSVVRELTASLPASSKVVVAYEPIWAIGTGVVASVEQIAEMHDRIRALLGEIYGDAGTDISILYGGSVNAGNAADIFALDNVNGGLVGGASLTAEKFSPVIKALAQS